MASGRLCHECEWEIIVELVGFHGIADVVDNVAGEPFPDVEDTDFARERVEAEVILSCRCSSHTIELDSTVSAFDRVPDEWDWPDNEIEATSD